MSSWAVNFIRLRLSLCVGQKCPAVHGSGRTGRTAIGSGLWEPSFRAGRSLAEGTVAPSAEILRPVRYLPD